MLSFLYVYSDHSILECYNLFSGVELSMRSFFVIIIRVDEDFWYMRGRYKLCTTNDEPNDEGWPYSSIFPTRSENAIPLNASLSKTASNAMYDQTKVENLKSMLFKDCRDSWTEFINLRMNRRPSGVGEKRK